MKKRGSTEKEFLFKERKSQPCDLLFLNVDIVIFPESIGFRKINEWYGINFEGKLLKEH